MNDAARALIPHLHAAPGQAVLVVTGGGSVAISHLLCIPGASRTVLEARVPYSNAALTDWLGGRVPSQWCSSETAAAMAVAAFERARQLAPESVPDSDLLGVAATATLRTDRPHQGEHRIHLAAQTSATTRVVSLEMAKNFRSREAEEELSAALILQVMAQAWSITPPHPLPLVAGEIVEAASVSAPPQWQEVVTGRTPAAALGVPEPLGSGVRRVLFPGAFNPLHDGHRRMVQVAADRLGQPVEFEITVRNVDKPALDYVSLEARLRQFDPVTPVWITGTPRFVEKAEYFAPVTFVVGADTIARIGNVAYYNDSPDLRDEALAELARCQAKFLVFGRVSEGKFQGLGDLEIPMQLRALCETVPESEFRNDVSSTELRAAEAN